MNSKPQNQRDCLLDFEAESAGAVNAYAQVLDTTRSLGFSFPFLPDGATVGSQRLEAVAWYYSGNTDAFLALQNTTEQATKVTLTMFVSGQAVSLGKRHLKSQQVLTIKLPSLASLGYGSDVQSAGLRVEYNGSPGSVVAQGWMVDAQIGFSFPFAFHYPSNCNCSGDTQHLYGTGIMIGAAMSASSDIGPIFSPYFTARNSSDKPLSITPIFSYVAQDHTEKVSLPSLTLNAQETAVVNLRKYQENGTIPMWVTAGNIDLQYQGESGALVAEMASVDQNGTFVPPVPLVCNGNRALHMSFWRTDGDWHSSVALQNIATEENEVEITISYPGGTYLLEKTIAAGGATMVSINELQQSQTPDREGRRIPANATIGGLNIWSRNVNNGLVINAMTMNPVTKTCGSCGAGGYVNWYDLTDTFGCTSGFGTYAVGESVNLMMSIHWSTSNCSYENPQLNSSSNTSVVNMSLQAVGEGSSTLRATSYQSYPRDISCSSYYRLTSQSGASVILAPTLTGPSSITRGETATFTIADAGNGQISGWQFSDGTNTVTRTTGTGNSTWSGIMVTSGTVSVTVTKSGRAFPLSKNITVNARTGFAFSAVSASKVSNGSSNGDGGTISVPNPPVSGGHIGEFYLRQKFSAQTSPPIDDAGPNQGFKYVTSVSSSYQGVTTAYLFVVAPDLENTSSTFYMSQCGNYNAQTNPNGFISGANLLAGTTRHEAGAANSHYNNYVVAQNDPANNLGVVGEMQIGTPSESVDAFTTRVGNTLNAKAIVIRQAAQVEPCAVNYDASCTYQGAVNFSPYQPCQ